MGTLLPPDNIGALLAIHAANPAQQDVLINEFIKVRWKQYEAMAYQACRRSNRNPDVYGDDVSSLIAMEAVNLVKTLVSAGPARINVDGTSVKFNYLVRSKVGNAVTTFFYSEAGGTVARGMRNHIRRQSQIRKTRNEIFAREMREPTAAEIIAVTNARLKKDRAHPEQECILVSDDDFQNYSLEEYNPDILDREMDHENLSYSEDYLLHPTEGQQIVVDTIAAAKEISEEIGQVAELWLGDFYPNGGDAAAQTSIMERTGLPKWTVSRHISIIKKIALEQLEAKLSPEDFTTTP
jgi:hypothetical protein